MPIKRSITQQDSSVARAELLENASKGILTWSAAVRLMRLSVGKNQSEFAKLFRLTRRQIAELEGGHSNPGIQTLNRLGRAFGLTVGFIPVAEATPQMQQRPPRRPELKTTTPT
jgi:transcriptional regulator with XRE-family HTH domain